VRHVRILTVRLRQRARSKRSAKGRTSLPTEAFLLAGTDFDARSHSHVMPKARHLDTDPPGRQNASAGELFHRTWRRQRINLVTRKAMTHLKQYASRPCPRRPSRNFSSTLSSTAKAMALAPALVERAKIAREEQALGGVVVTWAALPARVSQPRSRGLARETIAARQSSECPRRCGKRSLMPARDGV